MVKGAFDGITVLDFTQGIAGPHASMLLALHGADVIKIEPLDGDWGRALGDIKGDHCAHSIAFNRGKRSIALDLKSADGRAVVQKLAAKADVVMESFRPGVIQRLGFGYEDIRKVNPKVIYCSVSGFGQTGPYSKRPTVDGLIQAFSGMMVMNRMPDGYMASASGGTGRATGKMSPSAGSADLASVAASMPAAEVFKNSRRELLI